MSIFGKLDAATIPTNPFFIEAGEYEGEVTKGAYKKNRDGQRQLFIEYTITDESSAYDGKTVTDFFTLVDEDMTLEMLELLPADEKAKIRKNISALKRRLCGNSGNSSQAGLGVEENELNDPDWDPASLVGTKVNLAISNWGANNEGVNLKWVNLQ